MIGVNKAILIGTLGHDVETRNTRKDGASIANIRICTNTRWRDRSSGERREQTEWHSVVLFGGMADFVARHGKKGGRIYVEGYLQTRRYTKPDGNERVYTEVVAKDIQLLRERPQEADPGDTEANGNVHKTGKGEANDPFGAPL